LFLLPSLLDRLIRQRTNCNQVQFYKSKLSALVAWTLGLDVSGPVSEQHWNKASSIEEVLRTASLKHWPEAASALHDPKR
jgi:hypothetical protein